MAVIKFRIDDEKLPAIDGAAEAAGLSRSAWLKSLIEADLRDAPTPRPERKYGDDDRRTMIHIRFNARELGAIEAAASDMGIRRTDLVKKFVRGKLYEGEGDILPNPDVRLLLRKNINELNAIGKNVNQAARAINAAVMPDSGMNLVKEAQALSHLESEIWSKFRETEVRFSAVMAEENRYWRGDLHEASTRKVSGRQGEES